jgi:hypothetical protein
MENHKTQIANPKEITKLKTYQVTELIFGAWNFEFIFWFLVFGFWSF